MAHGLVISRMCGKVGSTCGRSSVDSFARPDSACSLCISEAHNDVTRLAQHVPLAVGLHPALSLFWHVCVSATSMVVEQVATPRLRLCPPQHVPWVHTCVRVGLATPFFGSVTINGKVV